MKIILIKYGELTTKKDNRKVFINILYNNIKKALINYKVNIINPTSDVYYGNPIFKNEIDAQYVIDNPNFRDILDAIYKN